MNRRRENGSSKRNRQKEQNHLKAVTSFGIAYTRNNQIQQQIQKFISVTLALSRPKYEPRNLFSIDPRLS